METKEEFKKRRIRQLIASVMIVPFIAGLVMAKTGEETVYGMPSNFVLFVSFVAVLALFGFSLWNWRCPDCSHYLGRTFSPDYCPSCGTELQ